MTIIRRLFTLCLLAGMAGALSGCIVEPIGPGWCYNHPYRCR